MTKSDRIREFLKDHGGAGEEAISAATGIPSSFVHAICYQRLKVGEFIKSNGGFACNPDFVSRRRRASPKEERARAKRKAAAVRLPPTVALLPLGIAHVRSTWRVVEQILDPDGNEMLIAALAAHREAIEMAGRA